MFTESRKAAGVQADTPPELAVPPPTPVRVHATHGSGLRAQLYAKTPVAPDFFILLRIPGERELQLYDTPMRHTTIGDEQVLTDTTVNKMVITPLIRQIDARFGESTSVLFAKDGTVWALDHTTAYNAALTGALPKGVEDGDVALNVPAVIKTAFTMGARFSRARETFYRWVGVALLGMLAVSLWSVFGLYYDTTILRMVEALGAFEVTAGWSESLRFWTAIMFSLVEVIGVILILMPILRGFSILIGMIDLVVHVSYGWKEAQDALKRATTGLEGFSQSLLQMLYSVLVTFLPELILAWLVIFVWQLLPLLPWALIEFVRTWRSLRDDILNRDGVVTGANGRRYREQTVVTGRGVSTTWIPEDAEEDAA